MKRLNLLFIVFVLTISYVSSQTYECFYENLPKDQVSVLFAPEKYFDKKYADGYGADIITSNGDYFWSCDGKWLYFTVIQKLDYKHKMYSDRHITHLFVAGPFNDDNITIKVNYITKVIVDDNQFDPIEYGERSPEFLISPDNKKIALIFDDIIKIQIYDNRLTSYNDFNIKSTFIWDKSSFPHHSGYIKSFINRGLVWSPNSDILYPLYFIISTRPILNQVDFYSVEQNRTIRINESPLTNDDDYFEFMKTLCYEHNSKIKKEKNHLDCEAFNQKGLKVMACFTSDYLYLKINRPKFKEKGNKKSEYFYYNNPWNAKSYRFNKTSGDWKEIEYFPDEKPCTYKANVDIESKKDIIRTGEVKGDWGQTIANSKTKITYKLVFKKH